MVENMGALKTQRTNAKWFQDQLQNRGISQRKLAAELNLDPSTISLIFHGKRSLKANEISAIARLLSVPMEEVLLNAGIAPPDIAASKEVLVKGWVDAAYTVHWEAPRGPKKVKAPLYGGPNLTCIRIQTAGKATAEGIDGALLFFRDLDGLDADFVEKLCVVKPQGMNQCMVRVIRRGYQSGTYDAYSIAGELKEEGIVLEAVSPVMWMKLG
jgi:transcriptional regulator with XRE-family HTH domain